MPLSRWQESGRSGSSPPGARENLDPGAAAWLGFGVKVPPPVADRRSLVLGRPWFAALGAGLLLTTALPAGADESLRQRAEQLLSAQAKAPKPAQDYVARAKHALARAAQA